MDAREDGVYITYIPVVGADAVTKKLGDLSDLRTASWDMRRTISPHTFQPTQNDCIVLTSIWVNKSQLSLGETIDLPEGATRQNIYQENRTGYGWADTSYLSVNVIHGAANEPIKITPTGVVGTDWVAFICALEN